MKLAKFIIFFLSITISICVQGQSQKGRKLIKVKDDYTHEPTAMVFPEQFEGYERKTIYVVGKESDGVYVTYEKEGTSFTINFHPAGDGVEGRLRNEYLKLFQPFANGNTTDFEQSPVRKVGAKYICNGFKAISKPGNNSEIKDMVLYECGTWFMQITITTNDPDRSYINDLEEKIVTRYDPTKLTELKLLNLKSDFVVAPALGKDRARAKYILNSGFAKLKWVNANVPENERVSGFPDLYLNMHIEAFKEFAECKVEGSTTGNDVAKLIDDVNLAAKAGYLPEYIMKQYSMVMIVPDGMKFNFEGYEKFAKENNIAPIDLNKYHYLIIYRPKKE
jgi:hypothetical protein